ncbi:MAG: hypothetical protein IMZ73_00960 [Chloroflexi bacterium]|nr:hypothetical protein [Chloroflexota bacterium]
MTRKLEVMLIAVLLAMALIGCQSVVANTPGQDGKPESTHEIGILETPNVLDSLIARAVADLAARLGVDAGQVQVFKTESVTWGDTSLGVPEPDNMYAQVLTPGYRLWFGYGGKEYIYHTDYRRVVFASGTLGSPFPPLLAKLEK